MRFLNVLIIGALIFTSSCAGTNKRVKTAVSTNKEAGSPIKEVEEKLVTNNEKTPDPSRYFVIIGSFRNPENARKYQEQILADGFNPATLKNESGLYRVAVMATDDIIKARNEIRRIWADYPEYSDTWLLIQKY